MNVFNEIRYATGLADVEQVGNNIIISGVGSKVLIRNMQMIWRTSRIAGYMFSKVTRTSITIPAFFALDFIYIIREVADKMGYTLESRKLKTVARQMELKTWISGLNEKPAPWLDRSRLKAIKWDTLLPHQAEFLNIYEIRKKQLGLKGYVLAPSMGGGKTVSCISVHLTTKTTKMIILSPKSALDRVWGKTLREEMRNPPEFFTTYGDREAPLRPDLEYHVFHYETLDRAIELAKLWRNERVTIAIDESQNFNEVGSTRSQLLMQLTEATGSENIIWASGTPVKALGYELIPMLYTLDPYFNRFVEERFKKIYGRDAKKANDILSHRFGMMAYIVPAENFMKGKPIEIPVNVSFNGSAKYTLPHITDLMRTFVMERTAHYAKIRPDVIVQYRNFMTIFEEKYVKNDLQRRDYDDYKRAVRTLMSVTFDASAHGELAITTNRYEKDVIIPTLSDPDKKVFRDIKSIVKYPALKVRGEALGRILTKERVNCYNEITENLDMRSLIESVEKKTLMFTSYVSVVDRANKKLKELGYQPVFVYGENSKELSPIVRNFTDNKALNPLIATYQTLSVGVPITIANGVVLLNSPFRSYERDQAIGRAHRIGQTDQVYVYEVRLDTGDVPNLASRSIDIMEWSRESVDAIMGIKGAVDVSIEMSLMGYRTSIDVNDMLEDVRFDDVDVVSELVSQNRAQLIPNAATVYEVGANGQLWSLGNEEYRISISNEAATQINEQTIKQAEKSLGLKFDEVLLNYLQTPVVESKDATFEYVGLLGNGYLSTVLATLTARNDVRQGYPSFPLTAVVLAHVGNGDYYIYDVKTGKIGYYYHDVERIEYAATNETKSLDAFVKFAFE